MTTNREEYAPTGVILQGSIGAGSTRINTWCAHFGQTLIASGLHTRRLARAAAWRWHDNTSANERAAMLAADAIKEKQNVLHRAALIIKEHATNGGDEELADVVAVRRHAHGVSDVAVLD